MSADTQLGGLRRPMVLGAKTGRHMMLFDRRVILTSAAAATAVVIIPNEEVPDGYRVYLHGATGLVSGGTLWATTATVIIRTKSASPVTLGTFQVADLTGDAFVDLFTGKDIQNSGGAQTSQLGTEAKKGEFADSGYGIEVKGNANGTGSDLYVRVWGVIAPPQLTTANWGVAGSAGGGTSGGNDELIRA